MDLTVGAAWASHFQRSGLGKLWYRRLRYAYRAPSLFLEGMLAAGANIRVITFDENLVDADLGCGGRTQQVDILYVATHGMTGSSGFELGLYADDWPVLSGGFGDQGPSIVVFDACNLVDLNDPAWEQAWRTAAVGPQLRLVLGFASPASVSRDASIRGTAFAQELFVKPAADAWFTSVQACSYVGTDRPIAIAFGENDADAQAVLDYYSVNGGRPASRASAVPGVAWRA